MINIIGDSVDYYEDYGEIVAMDLVDLEHCGFDFNSYDFELDCRYDPPPEKANFPKLFIINVSGGCVITDQTSAETKEKMKADDEKFNGLLRLVSRYYADNTQTVIKGVSEEKLQRFIDLYARLNDLTEDEAAEYEHLRLFCGDVYIAQELLYLRNENRLLRFLVPNNIRPGVKPGAFKHAKGVIPWKPGDEPAEVTIRRLRDNE
jgi:hypothetical protein